MLDGYLPTNVNTGPWISAYTLNQLQSMKDARFVLPICSIASPYADLLQSDAILLPPLFHEALDEPLKAAIVDRIQHCFPIYGDPGNHLRLKVVEHPRVKLPATTPSTLLAFSVDTTVEEHGPHLPLGTDTLQSYDVLNSLAKEFDQIEVTRPLDYGQLTWGLPFGFSVDLTGALLTKYVRGYINAISKWKQPKAIYVVDVHGSIVHRNAIVAGLQASRFSSWTFRWLHEPLTQFASERGDQHAGGVETALIERISPELLDQRWWPERIDEIESRQMSFEKAVELTPDLDAFIEHARTHALNGVVGKIENYKSLIADELFASMRAVAQQDIDKLLAGTVAQSAGENLW